MTTNFSSKKVLLGVILLLISYLFYNLLYINKVLPNIYLSGEKVSGKNRVEVSSVVSRKIGDFEKSRLVLEVNGEKIGADPTSLGITFDKEATAQKIFLLGRTGYLKKDLLLKLKAPFTRCSIAPVYRIDFSQFSTSLLEYLSKYEERATDATVVFKNNQWQVQNESVGKIVDRTQLFKTIFERIESFSGEPIPVLIINDVPKIKAYQADKALEKAKTLNNQRIILSFYSDTWRLSGKALFSLLKFFPQGRLDGNVYVLRFGKDPVVFQDVKLKDSAEPLLDVGLDLSKIDSYIDEVASVLDRPTVDATLRFESGKVLEFTPAQDGQKLDKKLTKQLILEKVSIENVGAEEIININLPVAVKRAKIANQEINSLGIRELLGRGVSYFGGSIANRIYNISLGASRLSSTLVKPGDIFSFNNAVGEVSNATGFKQAYVISSGRTVLDDGGGICQVSSTVFRAALAAGLPIVARTAHAYRVGYYEQGGFKAGLDATVWAPSVDFQFKNDTNHYVLVQAIVDRGLSKLQVDIYGTGDGRRVEMTEPVISNLKPPLPDKYQDDPTLPKGTVKQVDFAAWGANSVFARKVYKDGQLIIDDIFKSYFRPWQAVYLVGTGG